jgi:serine protease Do
MGDPLRSKLKVVSYTSLALVLGLALASGFRWVRGGEAATFTATEMSSQSDIVAADIAAVTTVDDAADQTAATAPSSFRALAEVNKAFVSIAESVTPAVVSVVIRGSLARRLPRGFEELFGPSHPESQFDAPLGRGSGFIVSEDGYIITNNHVVAQAERIEVELPDGQEYDAELIGRDPTTDIAVLKIPANGLPFVKLGDPDATSVGEFVLAIGNPGTADGSELPFTVTAGIISAKGRNTRIIQAASQTTYAIEDMIQTDAVINPGNSGGPLVNYHGEVIGVNTAIQSTTGFYQGYGFAIPITLAQDVMEDLIEYGRVRRAALRVSISPVQTADVKAYGLSSPKGAVVQDFLDDSPAEKAGLERGDVIVAIDGRTVDRVGQLQRIVASYEPNDRVSVEVVRYGKRVDFNVKLAEADVPQPEPLAAEAPSRPSNMLIGVQVTEYNSDLAERVGFAPGTRLEGVIVTQVDRFGPAAEAGLRQGSIITHVNGKAVKSLGDFDGALADVDADDLVSLSVVYPDTDGRPRHSILNMIVPEK